MRPAAPGSRAACTVSSICDASSLCLLPALAICGFQFKSQAVRELCKQRGVDVQPWRTTARESQRSSRSTHVNDELTVPALQDG